MNYKLYFIIIISSFLFSQDNPCDLTANSIYLSNNSDVWYNVDFDIGGFQWQIEGAYATETTGGDAETAGFTVSAANSGMVIGFSFTGASISSGCGILTQMVLEGNATSLSGIVFSDDAGNPVNVVYYQGSTDDGGGDDGGSDDCAGVPNGNAYIDGCGECVGGTTGFEECIEDCLGVIGGTADYDECGVCNGNGPDDGFDCDGNCLLEVDCADVCGGTTQLDECGTCGGDGPDVGFDCDGNCLIDIDCAGICGGDAVFDLFENCCSSDSIDVCGECDGNGEDNDNDSICDYIDDCVGEYDECGVCNGDGPETNYDCDGNCICNNPELECWNENLYLSGLDCEGTCGGTSIYDFCGICGGDNLSCSEEADHLILSRIAIAPNQAEMVQIYNPTDSAINLNDGDTLSYFITDGTDPAIGNPAYYYNITDNQMGDYWSENFYDFFLEFPEDQLIESGDTLTIALHDSSSFNQYYGFDADLTLNTLFPDYYYDMQVDGGQGLDILENDAEMLMLFYWDKSSQTVRDVDYFVWGPGSYWGIDKSDVEIGNAGDNQSLLPECMFDCTGIEDLTIEDNFNAQDGCSWILNIEDDTCLSDCNDNYEYLENYCIDCIYYSDIIEQDLCIDNFESLEQVYNDNGYYPDTPLEEQISLEEIGDHYSYFRISTREYGERPYLGNGITGQDETSENLAISWEIGQNPEMIFNYGCMDENYDNYDPEATLSYGSCMNFTHSILELNNGVPPIDEVNPEIIVTSGKILSFAQTSGPWIIQIGDEDNNQIEVIGYWDIYNSRVSNLIDPNNSSDFIVSIRGEYGSYNEKYQIQTYADNNIDDYQRYYTQGEFIKNDEVIKAEIIVAPYVVIPSIGERINFMYSFPSESRVIIRIFSLDGRFITSLVDKYYESAGTVIRAKDFSNWNGRDHLGQVVAPGTYLIHIEASNFLTADVSEDVAPIVVGVPKQ